MFPSQLTMTPSRLFTALALLSLTACNQTPAVPPANPQVESRLTKIESQLARIEEALLRQTEAGVAAQAAQATRPAEKAEPQVNVYVYGDSIVKPGEQTLREGSTVLMALASAGGPGGYSSRGCTVIRKARPDIALKGPEDWKNFVVQEGDVIVVRATVLDEPAE